MKRISRSALSLLLCLVLFGSLLPAPAAASSPNPFDLQDNKEVPYSGGLYFGLDASETEEAENKPQISVSSVTLDSPTSDEIAVTISVDGGHGKWSYTNLFIGYDTRLTCKTTSSGKPYYEKGPATDSLSLVSVSKTSTAGVLLASTSGSSNYGHNGVMYTLYFTLPSSAKAGDVYPIGIFYNTGETNRFTNVNQDSEGTAMQSWVFYKGITNGGILIKSKNPPVITVQPSDQTVVEGNSAHASFTFMLENASGCTYGWEYRKNSSDAWKTEQESTIFSDSGCGCYPGGWGSSQFTLQPISYAMNGWQFRCKITNSDGSKYTNAATLVVKHSPISTVAVTITPPAVGAKPDYSPVLPSDANYYSADFSNVFFENDVEWRDELTAAGMQRSSATFVAGREYTVIIYLTPMDGYSFSASTTATVNGNAAQATLSEEYDGQLRLEYTFPALAASGWQKLDGKWYYYENGAAVTGWKQVSGKWYYFDSTGVMKTGWQKISNKWYYFNSSGAMVTGWQTIGGKSYYFQSGGAMEIGRASCRERVCQYV